MDYYRVGYIAKALGIKGEVKVVPISNIPNRFRSLKDCFIDTGGVRLPVNVESVRPCVRDFVALKFTGYDDADSVAAFKGKYLEVDSDNLAKLKKGQYYVFDIIGCKVFTTDGEFLGEVVDVISRDTYDLFAVKGEKGDIFVPAIKEMVKDIKIAKKTIKVHLPKGLVE